MELSQAGVNACVAGGLSVIQGDADTDLGDYPDDAFDYVILSQTLQAHARSQGGAAPDAAGRQAGYRVVSQLRALAGPAQAGVRRAHAETPSLPYKWYDTPNIHLCSLDDFRALCRDMGVMIERAIVLNRNSRRSTCRHCSPTCLASRQCSCCGASCRIAEILVGPRQRPFVLGFDLVFPELHEAVAQVKAVGLATGQDFEPYGFCPCIGLGQQNLQDRGAESAIVKRRSR